MKPVHSPAPFNTAPPAGNGLENASSASTRTVTPVRAMPRPSGGGGSSRRSVGGPSPTPGMSRTALVSPVRRDPMTIPRSRARGMPASKQASAAAREGRAVRLPRGEDGAPPWVEAAAPSARFGTRLSKRPACDAPCMSIPVVWSPETRRHLPVHEIWVGVATDGTEVPERVDRILDALDGHELVEAVPSDETVLHRVHDPAFVDHLRTIHDEWLAGP